MGWERSEGWSGRGESEWTWSKTRAWNAVNVSTLIFSYSCMSY